jgi:Ca2+-binding RTX toxin-like protein
MPASFVSVATTGNALLDAIDGGRRWSGEIAFNRVDPADTAEVARFHENLPSPYVTSDIGLTNPMWDLVTKSLAVLQTYATFTYALTNGTDDNYLVSDFQSSNNVNVAGIAAQPGNTPILAFNRSTWGTYSDQQLDWIVLHELGHVLGLRHVDNLPGILDYSQYTIMSYNWFQLGDDQFGEGLPLTPMALDVALLQARYGAASANLGATTYALSNFGMDRDGADGFVQNGRGYICIWDSSGNDSIVYGGASAALINLNAATLQTSAPTGELADLIGDISQSSRVFAGLSASAKAEITDPVASAGGFFSSILDGDQRGVGGFTIANGARIESAGGGSGNDLIVGNELGNTLAGNGGKDDLFGGGGDDSLDGGLGDDAVFGGPGNDTVVDTGSGSNYLRGDEGDDRIIGGGDFDDINGNAGNDTGSGGLGDDWVVGGKDNDMLFGEAGGDVVWGNLGNDTQDGGDGNDQVRGGQGDDTITGGAGDDYVSGDRGNDTVAGGTGADRFHGSQDAGIDRVVDFKLAEGDRVMLDPGTTYTLSQVGADTVLDMGGGHQMILVGVPMSSLSSGWIFGA